MNKPYSLALILILFVAQTPQIFAQQQGQPPPAASAQQQEDAEPYDDEVVRITSNLVQVDAVVTDGKGRYVTNLRPEDFEIYEDGKRQPITNFSYITVAPGATATEAAATRKSAKTAAVTIPPARLKAEQVRRTIALVVDDLCMSVESLHGVRKALRKFADEQMQPGDLAVIVRTSGGVGVLQQFTNDKRLLHVAIERLRPYVGRSRCAATSLQPQSGIESAASAGSAGNESAAINRYGTDIFRVGMLGTINYVVRGLRELPGRKAVVLFSDGFKLINFESLTSSMGDIDNSVPFMEELRRLIDFSNRSSVVIYTMDARGLQTLGVTAADNMNIPFADNSVGALTLRGMQMRSNRSKDFFETQDGLNYLARESGGIFIRNLNDLSLGMRRVLEDQKGYYLIGYRPDESTFDAKTGQRRFHSLKVKLKPSGLTVRSRNGFYGIAESETLARTRTPDQQLMFALVSPFNASGVDLRMTSIFSNDAAAGSLMNSLIYVNARDLKFSQEADGRSKATISMAAVTFDGDGRPVDRISQTREVIVTPEGYERILKNGLTYSLNIPVKRPGAYQLRVALRDAQSERTGSASQFVFVPDLVKGRIALSGIVLAGNDPAKAMPAAPSAGQSPDATAEEADPQFGPAVRRIKHGMMLDFGYIIYNAQLDPSTNRPQLTTQVILFRDGQAIYTGKITPLDTTGQADLKRLVIGGRIQVGTEMIPGDYVLQVIVTDLLDKSKQRVVTQWTDFEVVK